MAIYGPSLGTATSEPDWTRAGSPTLARVMRGELCAGCGLCAGIAPDAIAMQLSPQGFARPYPIGNAVPAAAETAIAQACPGAVVAPWPSPRQGEGGAVHRAWGPINALETGQARDDAVRFAGSSGGILSALAIFALEAGLVDAVLHMAADTAVPLQSSWRVSLSRDDVLGAAGSRYAPSPLLMNLETLLTDERHFLVIGKPCDISALRQLGVSDPRVGQRFRWMLSFFCGGMPSLAGTRAIVAEMGIAPDAVRQFRYRGNGWPGTARAEGDGGLAREMSYARSWGDHLSPRVQYRCKICPDAVGGAADIAAADAWYGDASGYPSFDERDGRSLIATRNRAGGELMALARAAGVLATEPLEPREIDLMQPSQARRKRLVLARTMAARLLLQPVPMMRGLQVAQAARGAGWGEQLRNLLGSMRRIVVGRR